MKLKLNHKTESVRRDSMKYGEWYKHIIVSPEVADALRAYCNMRPMGKKECGDIIVKCGLAHISEWEDSKHVPHLPTKKILEPEEIDIKKVQFQKRIEEIIEERNNAKKADNSK